MYQVLSEVYDQMQEIDYTAFADYYEAVFQKFGCRPKLVLDLGCGTGNITLELARRGYDMIGLDNSAEMISSFCSRIWQHLSFTERWARWSVP